MSEGKGLRKRNRYKKKNPTEKIKLQHKEAVKERALVEQWSNGHEQSRAATKRGIQQRKRRQKDGRNDEECRQEE
jgi:hypothetical protein